MGFLDFLFGNTKADKVKPTPVTPAPNNKPRVKPSAMPKEYRELRAFRASNRKESDWAYSKYLKMISEINPYEKFDLPNKPTSLTSAESAFLKYMDGFPVEKPFIAQHWFYEEGFYYPEKIRLFMSQGYLIVSPLPNANKLTVAQLKEALADKGIDAKGKKADLILLITQHFDESDYQKYFPASFKAYVLTDVGKSLIKSSPRSVIPDLELEDRCIELISAGDFEAAAQEISAHDKKVGLLRGIGTSGGALIQSKNWYKGYLDSAASSQKTYYACCIFCDMIGIPHKEHLLAKRLLSDQFSREDFIVTKNAYQLHAEKASQKEMGEMASILGHPPFKSISLEPPKQKLEPSAKDNVDFASLCQINKTQSGLPMPLSEEEKAFILEMVLLFNYYQLDAAKIKLQRLGSGVFNVNYPGCYVGKFQIKDGQGFVQYTEDLGATKSVQGSADELVKMIPNWIRYIKWCNSNKFC